MGSVPFLSCFSEPPSVSLGCLFSFWVPEEPLSLRTEREGDQEFPCLFRATLMHPFCLEGGVVCRALECEFGSLGLGLVAGRAPEPPHGARGRSGVSLSFLCDPRASCSFGRRGCLLSLRVRVWVAGSRLGCRKSPRASARSERAIRSFPIFFVRPLRILFVRKEGLFARPSSVSLSRWVLAWL